MQMTGEFFSAAKFLGKVLIRFSLIISTARHLFANDRRREPSLTNVDTSTRGLSDGCSRPFGEYEHDIAHRRRMQRAAK